MKKQQLVVAVKEAIWVLLAAVVLATGAIALRPGLLQTGVSATNGEDESQAYLISLDAAAEHFHQGTAIFADARPQQQYQAGHIQGALNLDPDLFDDWSVDVFSQIPAEATIITYCDGERCTLSLDLLEKLSWLGYEQVLHIKNGWTSWKERGLPVDAGP